MTTEQRDKAIKNMSSSLRARFYKALEDNKGNIKKVSFTRFNNYYTVDFKLELKK